MIIKSKQNILVTQLAEFDFETAKFAKTSKFTIESGSECRSIILGPLQSRECNTKITFHEILLKAYYVVKS